MSPHVFLVQENGFHYLSLLNVVSGCFLLKIKPLSSSELRGLAVFLGTHNHPSLTTGQDEVWAILVLKENEREAVNSLPLRHFFLELNTISPLSAASLTITGDQIPSRVLC